MRFNQFTSGGMWVGRMKRGLGLGGVMLATIVLTPEARATAVIPLWAMPAVIVPEAERPDSPNIFGTIALAVRPKPTSTRWSKLMMASLDKDVLGPLTEIARERPREEQVHIIQLAVKQAVRTPPFSYNCSDDGYWAPAGETLVRGIGDCFDIAVAKMEALRYLGIPSKDLYLTTGRFGPGHDAGMGRESVALLVRIGEHFWLMDEQSEQVIEADHTVAGFAEFTPVLTYGVGITWVHGQSIQLATVHK